MKKNIFNPYENLKGCLIMIFIVGFIAISIRACFFTKDEEEIKKEKEIKKKREQRAKELEIISYAQMCVQQKLKAPATAEFELMDSKVWQLNDSTYQIKGSVDAQNSFGALLRSYYVCELIVTKDDHFICSDVLLFNNH